MIGRRSFLAGLAGVLGLSGGFASKEDDLGWSGDSGGPSDSAASISRWIPVSEKLPERFLMQFREESDSICFRSLCVLCRTNDCIFAGFAALDPWTPHHDKNVRFFRSGDWSRSNPIDVLSWQPINSDETYLRLDWSFIWHTYGKPCPTP